MIETIELLSIGNLEYIDARERSLKDVLSDLALAVQNDAYLQKSVPEDFHAQIEETQENRPQPTRIFIAYSRHQRTIAQKLFEMLISNDNEVFYDAKLRAGAVWRQTIQKALDDATHVIVIWTMDAAQSKEVEREVNYALAEHKVIVPILSKEIPKLPYHLHGLHYIVLEEDLTRIETPLLKAIAQHSDDEGLWQ